MSTNAYRTDSVTYKGRALTIEYHYDHDTGEPWKEHDGCGVVTEWMRKDHKRPEYRIISTDGESVRFYDVELSMQRARKQEWGCGIDAFMRLTGEHRRTPTNRMCVADAVERDFQYLKDWCENKWWWCWINVVDVETGENESLGGIEYHDFNTPEYTAYILEVIVDLCEQVYMPSIRAQIKAA